MRHAQLTGILLVLLAAGESAAATPPTASAEERVPTAGGDGLILQLDEGERRIRRPRAAGEPGLASPFILKVDRRNGGSPDLVMGYEEIAPGDAIRPHRHLLADEIIFVHTGSGTVSLGSREAEVGPGGTVYIPRNTRIALRNTGTVPLGIAFIFSKPGFEELMRANSVPEGEPATPLTAEQRAQVQASNRWHTVHEEPQPDSPSPLPRR
ncbi:MAG: cupin domain-containing protein [Allosphingosinicella sp.]